MPFGRHIRRLAPLRLWVAVALGAAGGGVACVPVLSAEPPTRLADVPSSPLIETLAAQRPTGLPAELRAHDVGAFQRLADRDALTALATPADVVPAPSTPPAALAAPPADAAPVPAPWSAAALAPGAPPDPVPTALAAAIDRLIVRDDRQSPLGDGDWGAARAAIGAFYADRGFRPVWIDAGGPTVAGRAVMARIALAAEDGLAVRRPSLPKPAAVPLDAQTLAAAEVAVAEAVAAYAEQASGSRIAPWRVSPIFAARPEVADPGQALVETAAAPDPGARLAAFNPPQRGYQALRDALMRLDEAAEGAAPRPETPSLDLLAAPVSDAPDFADDALAGAAAKVGEGRRRRIYLASAAHAARRNGSGRKRAAILANMEMWRWEPRDMGERRIEVNIPDFSVAVMDGDSVLMTSRVVVGKPDTPTTVFSDRMRYVLINPSWRIPDSIIRKEILPRLDHFVRLGYEVKTVGGRVVARQPPGDDNALGRLAFMFPNDHSIYLHDTPARSLFGEDMRALSHGCVRVEDPERLAEIVLDWPESRVEAAIGGRERTVFLPRPLPIHIEYFTEFVDEDGVLEARPDVYGLAQKVAFTLSSKSQD